MSSKGLLVMIEGFGSHSGEKVEIWKLVVSIILVVSAVYELLGVIYVRVGERPFTLEYTKWLQSLVSLFLVGYLAFTVNVIGTIFRDDTTCLLLSNVWWISYIFLSTVIHIFYWTKQRVVSTVIDTKTNTRFWWLRLLHVFCIFLIILTPVIGTLHMFPISKSYTYENKICRSCATHGQTLGILYVAVDCFCVMLLLILFVLPLWRFMRENDIMYQSQELRQVLIRNVVLCAIAVFTTIVVWVNSSLLYDNCDDALHLNSKCLITAIKQFVICNCILRTMTDWKKYLIWPCELARKTDIVFKSRKSNMKEHKESLVAPAKDKKSCNYKELI